MADDIRATRVHKILASRRDQLSKNLLVHAGGAPYIETRLTRFPHEPNTSWFGNVQADIVGRKDRAYLINYATRIATKINQLVLGQEQKRAGVAEDFALDATKTGMSISQAMARVSEFLTVSQWCWIGIDRAAPPVDAATGQRTARSLIAREQAGDRIWWTLWKPTEVVDWCYGSDGTLLRVITEADVYDNTSETAEPTTTRIRTIWRRGEGTRLRMKAGDPTKIESEEAFTFSAKVVPFVPVGIPTADPWWFDDVERVQASMLNLESCHHENLIDSVFPQLVIPRNLIDDIMQRCELTGINGYKAALELVRGLNFPLLEATDAAGLTRYLTPSAADLKAIPDEVLRRRKELYDIVGLAMQNETSQVASAEAKAWDHLDPEAVLKSRATVLEEAERKAVAISRQLDTSFPEYAPEYPKHFDVRDLAADFGNLLQINQLDLPFSATKEVARAAVDLVDKMAGIPDDRKQKILDEIDAMQPPEATAFPPAAS